MIAPEDAEAVNASGATMREALAVVLLAVIMRLILQAGGKFFSASKDGAAMLLWLGLGGAALLGLPSCTEAQMDAARRVPIKACYTDENGNRVCYSSKDGIEADIIGDK